VRAAALKPRRQMTRRLGRDVPVLSAADGTSRGKMRASRRQPKSVQSYIARAFGDRPLDVRTVKEMLATALPPEELNHTGFRLYERFRPDVPDGV
jgi:hypothetical protein